MVPRSNSFSSHDAKHVTVAIEANPVGHSRGELETMARRRFQDPVPRREGNFWYLLCWHDVFSKGVQARKRQRIKIAPATVPEREARKIAAEILRPVNQGLISV